MEKELRELIQKIGYTQKEFAKLLGVDRMSLRNYLQGRIPRFQKRYLNLVIYTINTYGADKLKEILEK